MTEQIKPLRCFLSFADSRMIDSLNRLASQAGECSIFDDIRIMTEESLDEAFREEWKSLLRRGVRGYGYYVWKPYVIWKVLDSLPEGSTLFYCDAGSHINPKMKKKFEYYYQELSKDKLGIKAFPVSLICYASEKFWTKGDVFDYFDCRDNPKVTDSEQLESGHVFFRKSDAVLQFVKEWYGVYKSDFSCVDDSISRNQNFNGFKENRHDQSIFSTLYKLKGGSPLPAGDSMPGVAWNAVLGKRDTCLHYRMPRGKIESLFRKCAVYVKYAILKCRYYTKLLVG